MAALHRDEAGNILADATVHLDSDPVLRQGLSGRRIWPTLRWRSRTVIRKDGTHRWA